MSSRPVSSLLLPSATLSLLTRAGYMTVLDVQSTSAEALVHELQIPAHEAEKIINASRRDPSAQKFIQGPSLSQASALISASAHKISTGCSIIDNLISGGLSRGQILEISGPPGTPKELIALNIAASFLLSGHEIIFIDSHNMTSPSSLAERLETNRALKYLDHVYYCTLLNLLDFMIFVHKLPELLNSFPKVALLVLSSVSFPFQTSNSNAAEKAALLDKLKHALTLASTNCRITIVTTSQLSTKILNADGTPGNFDTGARGVLVPQLGTAYLPGRAYRIILAAKSQTNGTIRLLSSPGYPQKTAGNTSAVPYEVMAEFAEEQALDSRLNVSYNLHFCRQGCLSNSLDVTCT